MNSLEMGFGFFLQSALLGVGLAMDAFSVSIANGLQEPRMSRAKTLGIALCYGVFQLVMPLTGWVLVHTALTYFKAFEKLIPWIALVLLGYIGGKMILEGVQDLKAQKDVPAGEAGSGTAIAASSGASETADAVGQDMPERTLTFRMLILQGIATSIDALSVGFVIADYSLMRALVAGVVIGGITFGLCVIGLKLGKRLGSRLAGKAGILGGVILVAIGLEIFISHWI